MSNKPSTSCKSNSEMEDCREITAEPNCSFRLTSSRSSSVSSECDLSFSLGIDCPELEAIHSRIIDDELPAFSIRLISPLGRTPSPIDIHFEEENDGTPIRATDWERCTPSPRQNNPDFVALHDINAQISPPSDNEDANNNNSSLETIYEGVFLHTPPRQRVKMRRTSLLEKVVINRLTAGKENSSPLVWEKRTDDLMDKHTPTKDEMMDIGLAKFDPDMEE